MFTTQDEKVPQRDKKVGCTKKTYWLFYYSCQNTEFVSHFSMKMLQRKINKNDVSFKIAKQNLNKPELNVLQGQRIHTLLHPYSALSHFDNLPSV